MNDSTLKVIIVVSIAVGIAGFATAQKRPPTKGYVPDRAFQGHRVDVDEVPDYFVVYARDGEVAGYISKTDYFTYDGPRPKRIKVVDESLSRAVGHMVAGRGFVPLGTPDEAIPLFSSRPRADEGEPDSQADEPSAE